MGSSVVVIGNFDGVHTGHQALLAAARQRCAAHNGGLNLVAVTFWPHPLTVINPSLAPQLLTDLPERIELLRHYGADEVRVVQFTSEMAQWSGEQFVETIIMPLDPEVVIVGTNFTFGKDASWDADSLSDLSKGRYTVELADLSSVDDDLTCSTLVRTAVSCGQVDQAARHLGRPYAMRGVVVVGDQRGRLMGFPTANLIVDEAVVTPDDGVYAGWVTRLDTGERMPAAISVGTNPTFDGIQRRVESYVLDRTDLELYGVEIRVDFVRKLRGQIKFDSMDQLIDQMNTDVANTRVELGIA